MKRCSTCQHTKPLSDFNVRRGAPDGRQARCRDCCKAWYAANSEGHKVNVAARNARLRTVARQWVADYLLANPCVDCGEADVRCLDFDHRPGEEKAKEIAKLVMEAVSVRRIQAEIAKCDVRCANCHRQRTAERGGFWRQSVQEDREAARRRKAEQRLAVIFTVTDDGHRRADARPLAVRCRDG